MVKTKPEKYYLVIADGSKQMFDALEFCQTRVQLTKFGLILLHVVNDAEFVHWLGVGTKIREDAQQRGNALLRELTAKYEEFFPDVQTIYREGNVGQIACEILRERANIASFVLGVDEHHQEAGDIIQYLHRTRYKNITTPIIIVPNG